MIFFAAIILLFLLVLAAFFAAAEVALVSVTKVKVRSLRKDGRVGAETLYRLKQNPRRMIITVLIGNNVVNVATSALVTVLVADAFGNGAVGLAAGILTIILLIFGEILPKTYAQARAARYSLVAAPIIAGLGRVLLPLIIALEFVARIVRQRDSAKSQLSEKDLSAFIDFAAEHEVIEPEERAIMNRAIRFSDTAAAQVMTPLKDVFAIPETTSVVDAAKQLIEHGFSRAPIYQKNLQHIVGIAILPRLVAAAYNGHDSDPVTTVQRKPLLVAATLGIDDVFKEITKSRTHLALVRDEKKHIVGIVTLEDLLEELVGEIDDENDRERNSQNALAKSGNDT